MSWADAVEEAIGKALTDEGIEQTLEVLLSTEGGRVVVRRAIHANVPWNMFRDAMQVVAQQAPQELARALGVNRRELAATVREGRAAEIREAVKRIPADLQREAAYYLWDITWGT